MRKPIIGITSAWENDPNLQNYFRNCVSIDYSKSVIEAEEEYLLSFLL